jgi:hypothetical protein
LKKSKRFPSQEYAASKARRLRRIRARAIPELSEAFVAGEITLRCFEILSRLTGTNQRAIIARQKQQTEHARLAAETINALLDDAKSAGASVRLAEVASAIYEAVQGRSLKKLPKARCRTKNSGCASSHALSI